MGSTRRLSKSLTKKRRAVAMAFASAVRELQAEGVVTGRAIADELNRRGVATERKWPLAQHHCRAYVDATGDAQICCRLLRSWRREPPCSHRSGPNTGSADSANSIGGDSYTKSHCNRTERARHSNTPWRQMAYNHGRSLAEQTPTRRRPAFTKPHRR
jgi:hypothetical protein